MEKLFTEQMENFSKSQIIADEAKKILLEEVEKEARRYGKSYCQIEAEARRRRTMRAN